MSSEKKIASADHLEHGNNGGFDPTIAPRPIARITNPLAHFSRQELLNDVRLFAQSKGLEEHTAILEKGALVAQNPHRFEDLPELDERERDLLRRETTNKWSHPATLYATIVICSIGAATQGESRVEVVAPSGR